MQSCIAMNNNFLDDKMLLGYLSFYNLGNLKIEEPELEKLFIKNGLDTKYIRKISPADVFRRATSSAGKSVTINYNGDNIKAYVEVNELRTDANGIVRLLGRKLVDEKNETLSYEVVGRMEFDRDTDLLYCTPTADQNLLSEYDYGSILNEVLSNFTDWKINHTKATIRNLANQIVKEFMPVNLMSSGLCKFIPKTSKDDLFALKGLIKDLSSYGEGNEFEIIPVIDTDEQRELVEKSAMKDIQEELKLFATELKDVLDKKSTIPVRTAQNYVVKYRELENKALAYESLVGVYMKTLHEQIGQAVTYVGENREEEIDGKK